MAKLEPEVLAHLEWLGYAQPTGLVVSAPALARAGAILDRRDVAGQQLLRECAQERNFGAQEGVAAYLPDFRIFAQQVLEWSFRSGGYAGTPENPIPNELELPLPDCGDTIKPDFAVRELEPRESASRWQLLVKVLEPGENFDTVIRAKNRLEASPHGAMERLLRHTGAPAGLLFNGRTLRLLSAPRGESSGWVDFRVGEMLQTAGRPLCSALRLLLREQRLLALPRGKRLAALLEDSRKFQNEVSERLAEQVLHALYELLRGFQAAHDASGQKLLHEVLSESPSDVYRGLLTVLLRMVFLLYAEERDMLPSDEVFLRAYSLAGLHVRLREDAALYPDTLDQRFGAWAQLLAVFRMLHDGASLGAVRLPARHGVLFDPDRFAFLEGRPLGEARQTHVRVEPPLVSDGTVYRALEKLLVLDGERISYRALDVEQIGSVYETMMGFRLETASGRSVAIKAGKLHGAPTTVSLDDLKDVTPGKREAWLAERIDRKLSETVKKTVVAAKSVEDLHAALLPLVDIAASPDRIPPGAMVLHPSTERRRSGSHYTPRSLTEPIVRTALEPILVRMRGPEGKPPRPEAILELKVCDPAMGSGAFLVETCRQLGDALVEAWRSWAETPRIPPDEDKIIFARRCVAQRCIYGVDRNPMAVDLAKVSLWLVTLAKEHALTFVDHALRHGDSLLGLSRKQIEAFHWEGNQPVVQLGLETRKMQEHLSQAAELRRQIRDAGEGISDEALHRLWDDAQVATGRVRLFGDLTVAAFFGAAKNKEREEKLREYANDVVSGQAGRHQGWLEQGWHMALPLVPFHWEIEFPEVFDRDNPGFDAMVGNPPFAGKNSISSSNSAYYHEWLKQNYPETHGNADLVAYFFRRVFQLIRENGTFGLIATNTIAQGDTRASGLRWICEHGGEIFSARKRVKWPGMAAVVVSVLHVNKGKNVLQKILDGQEVEIITAFLFHRGGHGDPLQLSINAGKSFIGSYVLGMGFTFDDTDSKGVATPISEMQRLIELNARNQEVIFPYIGGEELNSNPTHSHHRFVINFGERSELDCRGQWADLLGIVEKKVKPDRLLQGSIVNPERWWQFARSARDLNKTALSLKRVISCSLHSKDLLFGFLPARSVFSHALAVFPFETFSVICALQSRPHEIWARFFGSSMKDDLRYTPSDCFETYPFPKGWESHPALEAAGKTYYDFRAEIMVRNNQGLTKTYNRFHNPEERDPDIQALRELHAALDRAVLDAYGWSDIPTICEFLLDYEIDEEEWGDKKKPWRYRWPDEVRDEVLARLLELNAQRAHEEVQAETAAVKAEAIQGKPKKAKGKQTRPPSEEPDLFGLSK